MLVCEPGTETLFDLLQPNAANFLRPFSLAQAEHRAFRRLLEEFGIRVIELREALLSGIDDHGEARSRLQSWARQSLRLEIHALTVNGHLLSANQWLGLSQAGPDLFKRLRRHGVDAIPVDFASLTGGCVGPHCSTHVIVRE